MTNASQIDTPFNLSALIRKAFEADGFDPKIDKLMLPNFGTSFIFVNPNGQIFDVDNSFAATRLPAETSASVGSGAGEADGAYFALRSIPDVTTEKIITTAIEAAIHFDSACGGDIFVQKVHG